ncbi:response regulator transcription factor [Pseudalkalibacillus berkeleyi]|uniref:Response regulator transcription factor n=1 Tax=Pseudalkalibacillus berkeleyi TaxID=1069813 RepID=A0ABS9GU15_9BACL|nr:response regulator transcription factor [Pseudalkalibacillus berkeleyi]MCF6136332.1 response regulator transcription factor [Pseudalkalibacillus berkeleyi]
MNILVIEDNDSVCSMLEMFFEKEGFKGEFIQDGSEGYARYKQKEWDLIILDWMLPSMDGVNICKKIRTESKVPIIMLTAKDSESDQVLGLELGADDYVTKPFSPLTLMARIKAVARRYQLKTSPDDDHTLSTNLLKINIQSREVFLSGEAVKDLTPKEFDLLHYFAQHPRQVLSREQLLERVWGYQFYGDERTVDVHVKRLRKKVGFQERSLIHTVWGVGYKFDETVTANES